MTKIRIEQLGVDGLDAAGPTRQPSFMLREVHQAGAVGGLAAPRLAGAEEEDDEGLFSRQRMIENVEVLTQAGVRRGKTLLAGAKDLALASHGFVVEKGRGLAQNSVSKLARLGPAGPGRAQQLSLGMRFSSIRISFIGAAASSAAARPSSVAAAETGAVRSEILLVVLDEVRLKAVTNDHQQKAELAVRYAQVDNQSHKTRFPVLLSVAAADDAADAIVLHVDRSEFNDRIEYFEYVALQVRDEIHIQLEEEWLVETQSFLTSLQEQLLGSLVRAAADVELEEPQGPTGLSMLFRGGEGYDEVGGGAKNLYFDVLRLEPVNVKLDVIGGLAGGGSSGIPLPTVSNLTIRFTELQQKSPYGSAVHIAKELLYAHYRRQFMRKIYKVLGGYLQGMQGGVLINLTRGVYDCVSMPFLMTRKQVELIRTCQVRNVFCWVPGPLRGLIKGSTILVSNTVLGVTQSTSEVVAGLGSIIMKMSYGEQSYKLRRRNLMRVTPRHIFDGILLALLVTLTALFSALYDVLQPFWALRHCAAQGEQVRAQSRAAALGERSGAERDSGDEKWGGENFEKLRRWLTAVPLLAHPGPFWHLGPILWRLGWLAGLLGLRVWGLGCGGWMCGRFISGCWAVLPLPVDRPRPFRTVFRDSRWDRFRPLEPFFDFPFNRFRSARALGYARTVSWLGNAWRNGSRKRLQRLVLPPTAIFSILGDLSMVNPCWNRLELPSFSPPPASFPLSPSLAKPVSLPARSAHSDVCARRP